jgi:DNA-binding MarR family transcriptional regulator
MSSALRYSARMPKPTVSAAKDPLLCNGAALRKASRRVTQLYDTALVSCGITITQRSVLVHIERAGTPTMTELAYALVMDRSALAHTLKPLERDGYVELKRDEADGRSRRVELTTAGKAKLAESNKLWRAAQSRFEAVYGVKRTTALRITLSELFSDEFAQAFEG